jgi:tellurite resistance protein TehA-like permease
MRLYICGLFSFRLSFSALTFAGAIFFCCAHNLKKFNKNSENFHNYSFNPTSLIYKMSGSISIYLRHKKEKFLIDGVGLKE